VAGRYAKRPEIWRRLSRQALVELASPSLPANARERFERRIRAGEDIPGTEIAGARGPLPNGRPRQGRPAARMAA
jgi:hypothetical protein